MKSEERAAKYAEVVALLEGGMSRPDAARRVGISPSTLGQWLRTMPVPRLGERQRAEALAQRTRDAGFEAAAIEHENKWRVRVIIGAERQFLTNQTDLDWLKAETAK